MKHLKLFEDFLNESNAVPTYMAGKPEKPEGHIRQIDVPRYTLDLLKKETSFIVNANFDYNEMILDEGYRSKIQGNWDKPAPGPKQEEWRELKTFTEEYPKFIAADFDVLEVRELGAYKGPKFTKNEPRIVIQAKPWRDGKEGPKFLITEDDVLEIFKGCSVRYGIISGTAYLIDSKRAVITNLLKGVVHIRLQDGTKDSFTLKEWKSKHFTKLD